MMKIEMLRQNKIKILIDCDELLKWGINAQNVLENAPQSREMFVEILKKAERETGFHCNNSKLVIESAINSEENILTLYVTKVASQEENELFDKISYLNKAEIINSKIVREREENNVIAAFDSFDDIINMCSTLNKYQNGELYTYHDIYFMAAEESLSGEMSEFGELCRGSLYAIVREHGRKIIDKNAFSIIRENFKNRPIIQ